MVRLESGATVEDRERFQAWMDENPRHAVAYHTANAAWNTAERFRYKDAAEDMPADPEQAILAEVQVEPAPLDHSALFSRRAMGTGLVAASVAAAFGFYWTGRTGGKDYAAPHGQRNMATLDDGSTVTLNSDTAIHVDMDRSSRHVALKEGEALFEVAHDRSRPFTVETSHGSVRVLGTKFNLRILPETTELMVVEGLVAVLLAGHDPVQVPAGSGAVIGKDFITPASLNADSLRQRLAWTQGYIEFVGMPLEQAAAEFNRYRNAPIKVGDAALNDIKVSGRFSTEESEQFMAALSSGYGVALKREPDGSVILNAGTTPASRGAAN